jgi:hypothetical protein
VLGSELTGPANSGRHAAAGHKRFVYHKLLERRASCPGLRAARTLREPQRLGQGTKSSAQQAAREPRRAECAAFSASTATQCCLRFNRPIPNHSSDQREQGSDVTWRLAGEFRKIGGQQVDTCGIRSDQVLAGVLRDLALLRRAQSCQMQRMPCELAIFDSTKSTIYVSRPAQDFHPLQLRTRWSGVRISPGAPFSSSRSSEPPSLLSSRSTN